MKFRVLLSNLKKQLDEVAGIAGTAPNKEDITQNILINVSENMLNLKATNYNIELKTIIPLDDVESDGEITVNANKLRDTLSNLDINSVVSITLDEDKNVLVISDGNTSFEIRTRSSIDFPSFELEDIEQEISIKQCLLKSIIDSSVFCVSNEDFRDYLKGIRFELNGSKLEIFTSDGHRMAILETQLANQTSSGSFGAIITKKCAAQLSKILNDSGESEVVLKFTKNAVRTSCNNFSLASKLINCGYPNVRTVIPKSIDTTISIPRVTFNKLIQQVSVLSSKRVNGVSFSFGNGKVDLRSENSEHEVATASLVLPDAQTPIEISLNGQYVRDVLNVIKTDNVLFCFSQPMLNVLIKSDSSDNNELNASYIISKVVV
ncbi:MAG: DNA polymerase III subunit beta [Succinivibrio sp.]|jgi:DNA polymerase-3 subunit beta|uniref:Beta sliding clamp n=1 Tax=Succinivibrio dextrinosolvens DSM 3072 TaxID=1123324 RepID=A0A1T4V2M0_9GAMM|nr:DNA polymerase III subunit beta [Succinivibrio dextrinosolvens]MBE6423466.1 DNA polymerase III subunit beta [Succinivibrio dextrinosolvens]MBP5244205.1 DNA polymerase III subunit beta [Succinivibrio sp.]SKA59210.1 DNA polymerase-3 subunit beta [Succinivibrio dextrinosolvens DSM 3072]